MGKGLPQDPELPVMAWSYTAGDRSLQTRRKQHAYRRGRILPITFGTNWHLHIRKGMRKKTKKLLSNGDAPAKQDASMHYVCYK